MEENHQCKHEEQRYAYFRVVFQVDQALHECGNEQKEEQNVEESPTLRCLVRSCLHAYCCFDLFLEPLVCARYLGILSLLLVLRIVQVSIEAAKEDLQL